MELKRSRFNVKEIHSDLEQAGREDVLIEFKSRRLPILVATDILSRGIDIDNIEMVINYDVPNDGEDYIHRIGRTARAETDGLAFTFISEKEQNKFRTIEDLLGGPVKKAEVPAEFGPAPEYSPRSGSRGRGNGGGHGGGHGGGRGGYGGSHGGSRGGGGNDHRRPRPSGGGGDAPRRGESPSQGPAR
jgi:superfamily II DNA/RNA helicase